MVFSKILFYKLASFVQGTVSDIKMFCVCMLFLWLNCLENMTTAPIFDTEVFRFQRKKSFFAVLMTDRSYKLIDIKNEDFSVPFRM